MLRLSQALGNLTIVQKGERDLISDGEKGKTLQFKEETQQLYLLQKFGFKTGNCYEDTHDLLVIMSSIIKNRGIGILTLVGID